MIRPKHVRELERVVTQAQLALSLIERGTRSVHPVLNVHLQNAAVRVDRLVTDLGVERLRHAARRARVLPCIRKLRAKRARELQ